ncbi:Modifier of mdg4 [Operophtera brumata]|uniref:Modifier of mdg4 n=1 Tax=Operophtera brumata TaxID=104452 RepID=A0A0L7KZX1_OPEBR|nr:Modifier of mdg4 [Operophtera brumata]
MEYIYTGEATVPCDCLAAFGEAAKSLHIKGLENIVSITEDMILNRYLYNLNSTTSRTGLRRWRCVDYRNNKSNVHCHTFHDKKILAKLEKKAVFSAIDEVEAYKEKEREIEQASQITVEEEIYSIDKME